MPIYTYECEECGVRFDARQKFTDAPVTECPECGSHTHRVPQAVGIVFKGSGWYVTDSKGRNSVATPPKKEEAASDTKPAKPKTDSTSTTAAAPTTSE
jgi:putative FmdB family regulatory protein